MKSVVQTHEKESIQVANDGDSILNFSIGSVTDFLCPSSSCLWCGRSPDFQDVT